jgi:hypothetical protein
MRVDFSLAYPRLHCDLYRDGCPWHRGLAIGDALVISGACLSYDERVFNATCWAVASRLERGETVLLSGSGYFEARPR